MSNVRTDLDAAGLRLHIHKGVDAASLQSPDAARVDADHVGVGLFRRSERMRIGLDQGGVIAAFYKRLCGQGTGRSSTDDETFANGLVEAVVRVGFSFGGFPGHLA